MNTVAKINRFIVASRFNIIDQAGACLASIAFASGRWKTGILYMAVFTAFSALFRHIDKRTTK